ncbi:MAG: ComEA family DNA-binding protein [Anaerovibrio sp.]|uniref:ComEA family DNA-binding protein n=1 Tax=Anaerovibrio sp. TaxID=1872532 RepID=UPI0025D6B146|nr:ComEA family DNA-binding protein [Anaerovibrio sp.]MCR5175649.1 ComEA family DNA-binding protein [Anaerovibrio sp.]
MPVFKKSMLILLIIVLGAAMGTYYSLAEDDNDPMETATDQVTEPVSVENFAVYVCGAVKNPGVVLLSPASRVSDAVNICGGVLPNADTEKINMAQPIKDGMQITVPAKGNPQAGNTDGKKADTAERRININQASAEELTQIPGVGKATAQRIIEYRNQNGRFTAVEDLMKIKGIGKAKFKKIEPKVTI